MVPLGSLVMLVTRGGGGLLSGRALASVGVAAGLAGGGVNEAEARDAGGDFCDRVSAPGGGAVVRFLAGGGFLSRGLGDTPGVGLGLGERALTGDGLGDALGIGVGVGVGVGDGTLTREPSEARFEFESDSWFLAPAPPRYKGRPGPSTTSGLLLNVMPNMVCWNSAAFPRMLASHRMPCLPDTIRLMRHHLPVPRDITTTLSPNRMGLVAVPVGRNTWNCSASVSPVPSTQ